MATRFDGMLIINPCRKLGSPPSEFSLVGLPMPFCYGVIINPCHKLGSPPSEFALVGLPKPFCYGVSLESNQRCCKLGSPLSEFSLVGLAFCYALKSKKPLIKCMDAFVRYV